MLRLLSQCRRRLWFALRTVTFQDGLGRTIKTVQVNSTGAVLTQTTMSYDAVVNIAGYGDVVETTTTNGLGQSTKTRVDGAGRVIQTVDADGFITAYEYDANGNQTKVRDATGVGEDSLYDALSRKTQSTDIATPAAVTVAISRSNVSNPPAEDFERALSIQKTLSQSEAAHSLIVYNFTNKPTVWTGSDLSA